MTLGDLIWPAMRAKGMNATELAEQVGISRQFLYRLTSGEQSPIPDKVEALAKALDLDADEIYVAAGVIPPDIKRDLTTSVFTVRAARDAIARVLGRKKR